MEIIPETRREAVQEALHSVFDRPGLPDLRPIAGGASGALVCRFEAAGRAYALRLEPERIPLADRQRGYDCLAAAAEVGAAPAVLYADAASGVAIIAFIENRPLAAFPGGRAALVEGLGRLFARIREAPPFPVLPDYPEVAQILLDAVEASGLLAPGLLRPHAEGLARIRAALPWSQRGFFPAHNDPNPRNLLFDGERLWLVDWELAAMNDPLVDVAIGATEYAQTPELEDLLLRAAFGRIPDRALKARLAVVRLLTRIFYGAIVLESMTGQPRAGQVASLEAFTPESFRQAVAGGRLGGATPETVLAFAMMSLRAFLDGIAEPGFEATLRLAATA